MATPIPQNQARFSVDDIITATAGRHVRGPAQGEFCGVATDTREVLRGKVFVALRGERFDAHDYLLRAAQAGAAALLVESTVQLESLPADVTVIQVEDTLLALGHLAAAHRARFRGRIVAVAGSAGKTTTRSVISALLTEVHGERVLSTRGNLNNQVGVPMTLLCLSDTHDFAVLELGTNSPGEVALLAKMTRPDVAVLTLIDLEHTEGLGDLDGVEAEERAIFHFLQPDGVAIGFGEDERVLRSVLGSPAPRKLSYGFAPERDLVVESRTMKSERIALLELRRREPTSVPHDDEPSLLFESPLLGRPGALAVAAGVLAVEELQRAPLDAAECERALCHAGEPGRNTLVELTQNRFIIDDTYNSNPGSVAISVDTGVELSERLGGRVWLVLGEMLELGRLSDASHRQMGEIAANSGAVGAFFVQGDARISAEVAKKSALHVQFFDSAADVAATLAPLLLPGDVVVVKASRGVRAERVVEGLAERLGLAAPLGLAEPPIISSTLRGDNS